MTGDCHVFKFVRNGKHLIDFHSKSPVVVFSPVYSEDGAIFEPYWLSLATEL